MYLGKSCIYLESKAVKHFFETDHQGADLDFPCQLQRFYPVYFCCQEPRPNHQNTMGLPFACSEAWEAIHLQDSIDLLYLQRDFSFQYELMLTISSFVSQSVLSSHSCQQSRKMRLTPPYMKKWSVDTLFHDAHRVPNERDLLEWKMKITFPRPNSSSNVRGNKALPSL